MRWHGHHSETIAHACARSIAIFQPASRSTIFANWSASCRGRWSRASYLPDKESQPLLRTARPPDVAGQLQKLLAGAPGRTVPTLAEVRM